MFLLGVSVFGATSFPGFFPSFADLKHTKIHDVKHSLHPLDSRIAEALGLECIGWVFTSLPLEPGMMDGSWELGNFFRCLGLGVLR